MNKLVNDFIHQSSSFNTQRAYLKALTTYFNTDAVTIDLVQSNTTPKHIKKYIASMSKLSPSTIEQRLAALSSFINFINYYEETCIENHFSNSYLTKNLKTKSDKIIEVLTDNEIKQFLSVIKNNRDLALFKTLLNTGMRESEITSIKTSDILNINNKWYIRIHAINAKNNCHRDIYIPDNLKSLLDTIIIDKGKLFKISAPYIWNLTKKYAKAASIAKNLHPHIFRHTAITHCIKNGATIQETQRFAGHKSLNMTMRYFHEFEAYNKNANESLNF